MPAALEGRGGTPGTGDPLCPPRAAVPQLQRGEKAPSRPPLLASSVRPVSRPKGRLGGSAGTRRGPIGVGRSRRVPPEGPPGPAAPAAAAPSLGAGRELGQEARKSNFTIAY